MSKVSVRGGFSDRNKIKPESTTIQLKEFDNRTRLKIQNIISELYVEVYQGIIGELSSQVQDFCQFILGDVFLEHVDVRKTFSDDKVWNMINKVIIEGDYDEVLTLIEAIIQYWEVINYKNYKYENGGYIIASIQHLYKGCSFVFSNSLIVFFGCLTFIRMLG